MDQAKESVITRTSIAANDEATTGPVQLGAQGQRVIDAGNDFSFALFRELSAAQRTAVVGARRDDPRRVAERSGRTRIEGPIETQNR